MKSTEPLPLHPTLDPERAEMVQHPVVEGVVVAATPIAVHVGQWSSGCCDCFSDCGTCIPVVFCWPITTAQLFVRSHSQNRQVFLIVALLLWVGGMAYYIQNFGWLIGVNHPRGGTLMRNGREWDLEGASGGLDVATYQLLGMLSFVSQPSDDKTVACACAFTC